MMAWNILLAFFAAAGVILVLWCLLGLLLVPVFGPEMLTILYAAGDGAGMEHRVRAYGWLRDGHMAGSRLVIVDRGLTDSGKVLANRLAEQYAWLDCCSLPDLESYLKLGENSSACIENSKKL